MFSQSRRPLIGHQLRRTHRTIKKIWIVVTIVLLSWLFALKAFGNYSQQFVNNIPQDSPIVFLAEQDQPPQIDQYSPTDDQNALYLASERYNVSIDLLTRVAKCESGAKTYRSDGSPEKNPNSTASGLFQWLDSSFKHYSQIYGIQGDKNDPYVQAYLAADVIAHGGISNWNQSKSCWSGSST